tara:strand:+ start:3626 stop:4192 length:567 start_codon:yes stop_codon:yes gene_type:complete
MAKQQETWQESLERVRGKIVEQQNIVEETSISESSVDEEIEQLLCNEFNEESTEEEVILEASAGAMIDQLFKLKGDKDAGYGVAKMLNMTGVKVVQQMQKQNPDGFMKTVKALGKDNKIKLATNNALMKMFKDAGVKPLKDEVEVQEELSIEKLAERNMLGRLAKSLRLNEEGKRKMFAYFEKGELKQ